MSFNAETFESLFDFEALSAHNTTEDLFAWDADGDVRLAIDNHIDIENDFDSNPPVGHNIIDDSFAFIDPAKLDLGLPFKVGLGLQPCPSTQPFEESRPHSAGNPKQQIDHDAGELPTQPIKAVPLCRALRTTTRLLAHGSKNTTVDAKPNNEGSFLVFSAFDNHSRKLPSRRRLNPIRRKEVHEVRKIGSCVRCQLLKKPCGTGEPCPRCSALGHRLLDQPCVRENLAARAVYHQWKEFFTPALTHRLLGEEIGTWTGKRQLICLSYLGWSTSDTTDGPDLPPFWIQAEEYEPKQKRPLFMVYSFDDKAWFQFRQERRPIALKDTSELDIERLLDWTLVMIDKLLDHSPEWYSLFMEHQTMESYVREGRPDFEILVKGIRMRAAAYLLRVWPVALDHSGEGSHNAWGWSCSLSEYIDVQLPRALYNQIQMILQQRCGELEKELLRYLQRSISEPKRRKTRALFHYLALILLLSTYSFLGVKSRYGDCEKTRILVDCLTSYFKRMYQGYEFGAEMAVIRNTLGHQPLPLDSTLSSFPELLENLVAMFEAADVDHACRFSMRSDDISVSNGRRVFDLQIMNGKASRFTAWYANGSLQHYAMED